MLRPGAEYCEAMRDGRRVWVLRAIFLPMPAIDVSGIGVRPVVPHRINLAPASPPKSGD